MKKNDKILAISIVIITIIFLVMIIASIGQDIVKADTNLKWYKITVDDLKVRFAPGYEYDSFFTLTRNDEVEGEAYDYGGWTKINCYGYIGYVDSYYIYDKPSITHEYYSRCYVTGYNPYSAAQCGKSVADGITASGKRAVIGDTVAMYGLPFGTRIYIDGLGYYTVHDRGVGKNHVDIACGTNQECYNLTGYYDVYLVNYE